MAAGGGDGWHAAATPGAKVSPRVGGIVSFIMSDHHDHRHSLISNWRQPMPFWRKLQLALANLFIRIRTRGSCCGNYGQPGC